MTHGIVICHGELAGVLVKTVERILGPVEKMTALSNSGLTPQVLFKQVENVINEFADDKPLVMVDLKGGSCWTVGRLISREYPDTAVVSGVNLPMLISFLTKRESLDYHALTEAVRADAVRGVTLD